MFTTHRPFRVLSGLLVALVAGIFVSASVTPARAGTPVPGKIVLANDEWTLDTGFFPPNDPALFVANTTNWFTGGRPGRFLAYSNNHGVTSTNLADAVHAAGHSWTVSTAVPFNLPTLLGYDGVFVGGYRADNQVLTDYVNAGGNVYAFAGTGDLGDAASEAGAWNPFLSHFGLAFDGTRFNGVQYTIPIHSDHPIFAGVDDLYQDNGSSVIDLDPQDPRNRVLVSYHGEGLYGVFDAAPVPEPGTLALLAGPAGVLLAFRRRRR